MVLSCGHPLEVGSSSRRPDAGIVLNLANLWPLSFILYGAQREDMIGAPPSVCEAGVLGWPGELTWPSGGLGCRERGVERSGADLVRSEPEIVICCNPCPWIHRWSVPNGARGSWHWRHHDLQERATCGLMGV